MRGFVPIVILAIGIILLSSSAIIYNIVRKPEVSKKAQIKAVAVSPSTAIPSPTENKITISPTPYRPTPTPAVFTPTPFPTLTPTPTSGPTPTKAALSSTNLTFNPPSDSTTPQGGGDMYVEMFDIGSHYSNDPNYKILSFRFNGHLNKLMPNRDYSVSFCWRDTDNCVEGTKTHTDDQGNASFRQKYDNGIGFTYYKPNPLEKIKVTQVQNDNQPSNACYYTSNPCLQATYVISLPN